MAVLNGIRLKIRLYVLNIELYMFKEMFQKLKFIYIIIMIILVQLYLNHIYIIFNYIIIYLII